MTTKVSCPVVLWRQALLHPATQSWELPTNLAAEGVVMTGVERIDRRPARVPARVRATSQNRPLTAGYGREF
jgi:hypothetical protein